MDLINCWDCPISLSEAIAPFALLIPVALISTWASGSTSSVLRQLGRLLLVVVGIGAFLLTNIVLRWGIRSEASATGALPTSATTAILLIMNIVLVLTAVLGTRRWRVAH